MPNLGRQHGMPRPSSSGRSRRPLSAGPGHGRSTEVPITEAEVEEKLDLGRQRGALGKSPTGNAWAPPAAPGSKVKGGIAKCTVCKMEPLIFRECPQCSARYCSSGCLQSWYEHCKPSRGAPFQVPVESVDGDYIKTGASLSEDNDTDMIEMSLSRVAGGFVIADDVDSPDKQKIRWNIASVDGWVLGMPGPGPDWNPSPGVKLTLEPLGSCKSCSTSLAIPEYICNSASRPRSASRGLSGGGVQKPRVKMVDAETQTEVEYATQETQVDLLTVQDVAEPRQSAARLEATLAGAALASLAVPAPSFPAQMVFENEPSASRRQVRSALASVAALAASDAVSAEIGEDPDKAALIALALKAAQDVEAATASLPDSGSQEVPAPEAEANATGSKAPRCLGHRMRAAVPSFEDPCNPRFQAGAVRALASGAVAALQCVGDSSGHASEAPVQDALVNLTGLLAALATSGGGTGAGPLTHGKILEVLRATARLLQPSWLPLATGGRAETMSGCEAGASAVMWSKLAAANDWPWASSTTSAASGPHPPGWLLLQRALSALRPLTSDNRNIAADLDKALCSLGHLALFLDFQDVQREDAQIAQTAHQREEAERAQAAALMAAAPPPPLAPPGGGVLAPPPLPVPPGGDGLGVLAPLPPPVPPGGDGLGVLAAPAPPVPPGSLGAPAPLAPPLPPCGAVGFAAPPAFPGDSSLGAPLAPPAFPAAPVMGGNVLDAFLSGQTPAAPLQAPDFSGGGAISAPPPVTAQAAMADLFSKPKRKR